MLKMYHPGLHSGQSATWDENWNDGQLEDAIRFSAVDPLRPVFEKHVAPGTRLLEGGCGRGQYVVYYGERGVRVTGLDFARETLRRLKRAYPRTIVCAGDVSALPFRNASHEVYFSGGVVEHLEAGPLAALVEARRVLAPGGTLLVSVPYLSPLRRLSRLWRSDRRFVRRMETEPPDVAEERSFWQYAFGWREFGQILEESGFRVLSTVPYALLFGLYDLPFANEIATMGTSRALRNRTPKTNPSLTPTRSASLIKRIVVSEDRAIPGIGPLIEAVGRLCGNMMLYVCVK